MNMYSFYAKNKKLFTILLLILIAIVGYGIYNNMQKKKEAEAASQSQQPFRYIGSAVSSGIIGSIMKGEGGSKNLGDPLSNLRLDSGPFAKDPLQDEIRKQAEEQGKVGYSGYYPDVDSGIGILDPQTFSMFDDSESRSWGDL